VGSDSRSASRALGPQPVERLLIGDPYGPDLEDALRACAGEVTWTLPPL
jgi:hypothetical protein